MNCPHCFRLIDGVNPLLKTESSVRCGACAIIAIGGMINEIDYLEAENSKLRELLRWRSTESEVPDENEFCLVIVKNSAWPNVIRHSGAFPWSQSVITHWRPIGPLPGGE